MEFAHFEPPQDRRELRTAAVLGGRMVVEGLIWSFCLAFGRTPPGGTMKSEHAGAGGKKKVQKKNAISS